MGSKPGNYAALYDQLCTYERLGQTFTVEELAEKSDYKPSSLRVYIRNRLRGKFIFVLATSGLVARNVLAYTKEAFVSHMDQRRVAVSEGRGIAVQLVKRSIASFYLALENYNRPTSSIKDEVFCILMVNAWELLLKSVIVDRDGEDAILDNDKSSLGVSKVVRKLFPLLSDPIRGNLETVIEMRNCATHYLLRETSSANVRIFQTCVVNYLEFVKDHGLGNEIEDISSGLIVATSELDSIDYELIGRRYSPLTAQRLQEFQGTVLARSREFDSSKFIIPVEHKLIITKNPDEGEIRVSIHNTDGNSGFLVEVPKDLRIPVMPFTDSGASRSVIPTEAVH